MRPYKSFILLFFVAIVTFNLGCRSSQKFEPIKIGFITALTDKNNPNYVGEEDRVQAAQLAVEEINDAGGIYGRQLDLLVEDSRNDNLFSADAARKLLEKGAVAIIGPTTSSQVKFVADSVTIRNGVTIISPSATSPELSKMKSDSNNTVWRTCPSDELQSLALTKLVKDDMKKSNVSILFIDNLYGKTLASEVARHLSAKKVKVLSQTPFPEIAQDNQQFDFSKQIAEVMKAKPEVLMIISSSEGGKIIKDLSKYISDKKVVKPLLVGCDGNFDQRVLKNADPAIIEGMVGTTPGNTREDRNYKTFAENFKTKYKKEVTSNWAAKIYDAVYLVAFALGREGSDVVLGQEAAKIKKGISENLIGVSSDGTVINAGEYKKGYDILLNQGKINYDGASGGLELNTTGDVSVGTYIFWKVENGKYVTVRAEKFP